VSRIWISESLHLSCTVCHNHLKQRKLILSLFLLHTNENHSESFCIYVVICLFIPKYNVPSPSVTSKPSLLTTLKVDFANGIPRGTSSSLCLHDRLVNVYQVNIKIFLYQDCTFSTSTQIEVFTFFYNLYLFIRCIFQ
jgi:hypothetical protein